jgi:hypothetical protein
MLGKDASREVLQDVAGEPVDHSKVQDPACRALGSC